jgi:pimeloyl-ACP methyl ester carboxylesterase
VLDRFGMPPGLRGVVTLASPFWGAPDWPYAEFGLSADAAERLLPLRRVIIMRGDRDEVVAADHPERYRTLMPQAELRSLPGIDHEAAEAAPQLVQAILDIAAS